MSKDYTYAVARIRGEELSLFSNTTMEQLMACRTYDDALRFLREKGWGDSDKHQSAEEILEAETEKTWDLIGELTDDLSVFDVFRITDDYHNLKAAIKQTFTNSGLADSRIYVTGGTMDPKVIERAVRERDFSQLPPEMAQAAQEAQDTLLHTGDGQLVDVILDKAALSAVYEAGKKADHEVQKSYAVLTVVSSDIKIAVRCGSVGKSLEFTLRALVPCDELDVENLAHAALSGVNAVADYLSSTDYAGAGEALKESPEAFERWCDNVIIEEIEPQKYNPFTVGPLAAYLIARFNEIKCVRMVLSGKQNELPEETIRERLREMYV